MYTLDYRSIEVQLEKIINFVISMLLRGEKRDYYYNNNVIMGVCKFMLDELKFVVSLIVLLGVLCLCLLFCVTFSGVYFNESCIIVYCKQFLERCVLIQCVLDIVKSLYYSVRSNHLYTSVKI